MHFDDESNYSCKRQKKIQIEILDISHLLATRKIEKKKERDALAHSNDDDTLRRVEDAWDWDYDHSSLKSVFRIDPSLAHQFKIKDADLIMKSDT